MSIGRTRRAAVAGLLVTISLVLGACGDGSSSVSAPTLPGKVGAAMRALNLPIAAVRTAWLCRTETTGRLVNLALVTDDYRLDASSTWANRGGAAAEQRATLQVLSEQPPTGTDLVLISSALDILQPQPAVLRDLGPGETAVFRPGPAGKATLLARIGESAWPTLLQALATVPLHQLDDDSQPARPRTSFTDVPAGSSRMARMPGIPYLSPSDLSLNPVKKPVAPDRRAVCGR